MKQKEILLILISSAILVLVWIIFSIYHSTTASTIPEATSIQIVPITPSFDKKIIDLLRQRQQSSPLFDVAEPTETPTPIATPTTIPISVEPLLSPTPLLPEPTSVPTVTNTEGQP